MGAEGAAGADEDPGTCLKGMYSSSGRMACPFSFCPSPTNSSGGSAGGAGAPAGPAGRLEVLIRKDECAAAGPCATPNGGGGGGGAPACAPVVVPTCPFDCAGGRLAAAGAGAAPLPDMLADAFNCGCCCCSDPGCAGGSSGV